MKYPEFLKKGGTIGVTAPSMGVTDETDRNRFANARKKLSERGYSVLETDDVYGDYDGSGRSASAEQRAKELCSLFENQDVDVIISAKGGDYQEELERHMDWDTVEDNPKWFQGYSDNTNTAIRLTVEHDIASVYAGNFGDFGMDPWHRSVSEELEFLEGKMLSQHSFSEHEVFFSDRVTGTEPLNCTEKTEWICDSNNMSGRLIGGCMDILEWMHRKKNLDVDGFLDKYSSDGIIWYMETYEMDESRIRRMLSDMKRDGWFDSASGFVFGRPLFYEGHGYRDVVCDELKSLDVPVVTDADVGHKAPRMVFVNGAFVDFTMNNGSAEMKYKLA